MKRRAFQSAVEGTLQSLVCHELKLSPDASAELVAKGAVYVKGRRAQDAQVLLPAATPVLVVLEESGRSTIEDRALPVAPLRVLFENDDVVAVDKPAGVLAQPSPGRVGESLVDQVSAYLGSPAGLVHRLDRETSGVTIFGKHQTSTARLAQAFREGTAKKRYLAATPPQVPEHTLIELPLSRDPSRPGRWRASLTANGIAAVTELTRLGHTERFALLALFPRTGRTHQLRAHLTALGAPILGDVLYAGSPPEWLADRGATRCLLHAQALQIDGGLFEAPLPADLYALFEEAKVAAPLGGW